MEKILPSLEHLILYYPAFKYLFISIGIGFGADYLLLAFGFMAAINLVPIWAIVVFGLLGTSVADALWFLLFRSRLARNIKPGRLANFLAFLHQTVHRLHNGNFFLTLFVVKFIYGARLPTYLYLSRTGFPLSKFMAYNTVAILAWIVALGPVGYLAGLGYTYLAETLKSVYVGVGLVLLIVVLFIIFQAWLKHKSDSQKGNG